MKKLISPYFDALILLNGEKPSIPCFEHFKNRSKHIIAADGAYDWAKKHEFAVDVVIGDMDSISADNYHESKFIKITEQETNDLDKSLRFCIENSWKNIIILGALGLRTDHVLTNIFTLQKFQSKLTMFAVDESQLLFFCPPNQTVTINLPSAQDFFSLYPCKELCGPVYLAGVEYPLEGEYLKNQTKLGTLNRATKGQINLMCMDDSLLVIMPNILNL